MKTVQDLSAHLLELFGQVDDTLSRVSHMSNVAYADKDAKLHDLLGQTYWDLNEARRAVIIAMTNLNTRTSTQGETK